MCGASSQQTGIFNEQKSAFTSMLNQAQQVFGDASSVFNDLKNSFEPIVAAGPNQEGFNQATKTALNSQVTEGTAQTYSKASKAVGEQMATAGGGDAYIPSGATAQVQAGIANNAAQEESKQKLGIVQQDYATGRENYFEAARGLAGASGVFNPSSEMSNATTNSGNAAANTANQIAQADNSWMGAVGGALGAIGGAAMGHIPMGGSKGGSGNGGGGGGNSPDTGGGWV